MVRWVDKHGAVGGQAWCGDGFRRFEWRSCGGEGEQQQEQLRVSPLRPPEAAFGRNDKFFLRLRERRWMHRFTRTAREAINWSGGVLEPRRTKATATAGPSSLRSVGMTKLKFGAGRIAAQADSLIPFLFLYDYSVV